MSAKPKEAVIPPAGLPAIIKRLGERRAKLDSMDDRISDAIKLVENVMRNHVAVRITTVIAYYSSTDFEQLAFTKMNGRWCLAVEDGSANPDGDDSIREQTPLGSCSREKRSSVFAGGHVEKLLANGIVQVDREIEQREHALASADRLVTALSPMKGDENANSDPDDGIPF